MPTSAEKRAKIIAAQVEREKAAGPRVGTPSKGKARSNWTTPHPGSPRRRWAGGGRGSSGAAPGIS